jgi:ABC-type lipoprotein release transport system permease subunit
LLRPLPYPESDRLVWLSERGPNFPTMSISYSSEIGIDAGVLAFTVVVAVLTGILFGLAPAWQASRPDVQGTLKDTGRGCDRDWSWRKWR